MSGALSIHLYTFVVEVERCVGFISWHMAVCWLGVAYTGLSMFHIAALSLFTVLTTVCAVMILSASQH